MSVKENWKQEYLYRTFSQHTRRKDMENYVINAIWARLDDLAIQPVSQQYVRRPNGYALIDLYFPQISYGIECDEAYHKNNSARDVQREIDLVHTLSACNGDEVVIRRVDATLNADDLHACIREIVKEIRQKIAEKGEFLSPWLSSNEKWGLIQQKGVLSVEDAYSFTTISEVCKKCFGKEETYRIQRCYFRIDSDFMLWCPKLAIHLPDGSKKAQSHGWVNELAADWSTIIEYNENMSLKISSEHINRPRATFAKSKDELGENAYRFVGVFQWSGRMADGRHVYKRTSDRVRLK